MEVDYEIFKGWLCLGGGLALFLGLLGLVIRTAVKSAINSQVTYRRGPYQPPQGAFDVIVDDENE